MLVSAPSGVSMKISLFLWMFSRIPCKQTHSINIPFNRNEQCSSCTCVYFALRDILIILTFSFFFFLLINFSSSYMWLQCLRNVLFRGGSESTHWPVRTTTPLYSPYKRSWWKRPQYHLGRWQTSQGAGCRSYGSRLGTKINQYIYLYIYYYWFDKLKQRMSCCVLSPWRNDHVIQSWEQKNMQ